MFSASLEGVDFFWAPLPNQSLSEINVSFDAKKKRVNIETTLSNDPEISRQKVKDFKSLMCVLNEESFINKFYLERTDFFGHSCQLFAERMCGETFSKGCNYSSDIGIQNDFVF